MRKASDGWNGGLKAISFLGVAVLAVAGHARAADVQPLDDAIAVWHMRDLGDSAGRDSRLTTEGDAKVGVELQGAEREASLRRGGDGYAAQLDGGYLAAGQGAEGELNPTGESMSLCIRLRDPSGKWNAPLFTKHGGHDKLLYNLYSTGEGPRRQLNFELGSTGNRDMLQLRAPLERLGPDTWHDVVVRCDGAKVQLFVDGVWQDEDFVVGSLRAANAEPCLIGAESIGDQLKSGLGAVVDHAALWDRALSNEEITALSGGAEKVAARRKQLAGRSDAPMQYFRPQHEDWNVGDCLPMFHDGTYHFLYLIDKRHHRSKNGLGAHQWAHASTRNLVHWEHHPLTVPVTKQWEGSICTGSMFWHDGTYYAFYATRMADRSGEYLSLSTSKDGIHFEKQEPNPFAGPENWYVKGPFRDPTVFEDPETGLFHMLVTARLVKPALRDRGDCLAHLVSKDLKSWEQKPPFFEPGYMGAPECPEHFHWNGWYYLVFSNQGTARYRMSRKPLGPWTRPKNDTFGGPMEFVAKSAAFTGNRRIQAAWIGKHGWAGNAVFREIIQHEDGTLGTKFPPEMTPKSGDPLNLSFEALTKGASSGEGQVRIDAMHDMAVGALSGVPHNARITMRVTPKPNSSYFGVCLRGVGDYESGNELRFSPQEQKVGIRGARSAPRHPNEMHSLYNVEGLDRPFTLEIILKDELIDVCIDNRRTMLVRLGEHRGDRLFFFAHHGDVTFDSIEVRPLH